MSADPDTSSSPSVLRMAAPLVVSFWMRAAVTLVDTVYASLLGDPAVAAIGLTVPLEFLMIAGWVGVSTGITSGLSRAMGAGAHAQVEQYLDVGRRLVWVLSVLFTAIGAGVWFVAPHMGLQGDLAHSFQIYGTVLITGSAVTTFWSILPDSLVKAHHDTRSTMWAGILTNVINVSLNSLFLFVFHWGILGIALSTVLSRIGGLVYAIHRAGYHERLRRAQAAGNAGPLDPRPNRAVLNLAVPASVTFALMATETGLINALLARLHNPTEAIAAYSIFYRLVLFGLQPVIAVSVAMLPFAARRGGGRDFRGIRRGFRQANFATAVYCVGLLTPLLVPAAPWIASRLTESSVTAEFAVFGIRLVPLACLATTPFLLCRPVFEALQRGTPGLVMAILRYVVLTAPLAYGGMVLAGNMAQPEIYGVMCGSLVAAALSSAAFYVWLRAALLRTVPASG